MVYDHETRHPDPMSRHIGVLEQIIKDIEQHDKDNPTHGVGCACHDNHSGKIRRLIANMNEKSRRNFLVVLGYVYRNPR